MVIATKYTSYWKGHDNSVRQKIQYVGNGNKALHLAVEGSLKKLRTTYIDILYVHWYDWETSIEEMMSSLHNLVVARKVLYIGISDAPAWVVARANQWAIDHAKTPFCIYQGQWSLAERSFEREIIPMAREMGLALAPWQVLGSGRFRTDAEDEEYRKRAGGRTGFQADDKNERSEADKKVSYALEKVAKEVGAKSIQAVAIAYHLQKTPYVYPIIGCRSAERIQKNVEALTITLSPEQIEFLESAVPFEPGFPLWFIGDGTKMVPMVASAAEVDKWPKAQPIRPSQ
ncbi:hypothetical protein NM688_g8004 [Phlebia brevispora]|uniref:Uncharacterized protein n=1 Tax=Phlebia brevispora TaxID=194682 RepID=A0ACC1RZ68_9APHY|nr:hypothetical protein NM688_g8004 [Phlebia brevispora]